MHCTYMHDMSYVIQYIIAWRTGRRAIYTEDEGLQGRYAHNLQWYSYLHGVNTCMNSQRTTSPLQLALA